MSTPRIVCAELDVHDGADGAPWHRHLRSMGLSGFPCPAAAGARRSSDWRRGSFRLVVSEPVSGTPRHERVLRSGDRISSITIAQDSADAVDHARAQVTLAGARPVPFLGPVPRGRDAGSWMVPGPGGLRHILCDASAIPDPAATPGSGPPGELDHIALVVPPDKLEQAAQFYEALGLTWHRMPRTVLPGGEAMDSGWLSGGSVRVTIFTLAGRCDHLSEFLDANEGQAAVQHLALGVENIIADVDELQQQGVGFAATPAGFYAQPGFVPELGDGAPAISDLARTGVLADTDEFGWLLQIFTRPLPSSRVFVELIQRRGAMGFGENNITRLAEALDASRAAGTGQPPAEPAARDTAFPARQTRAGARITAPQAMP